MYYYICEIYPDELKENPSKIVKHFHCTTYEEAANKFIEALETLDKIHCLKVKDSMPFIQVYDPIDPDEVELIYGAISAREIMRLENQLGVEVIDATQT